MNDSTIQASLIKILESMESLVSSGAQTFWTEWEDLFSFIDNISEIDENGVI